MFSKGDALIANCPYCQNEFYFPVDLGGETVKCTKCRKPVHAPVLRPEQINMDFPCLLVGSEGYQKCLEGIRGIRVHVAAGPGAEKLGLSGKKIHSDIEIRLHDNDITLLTEEQLTKNPRMPVLAVSVQALQGPMEYVAFKFEIQFFQKVTLCNGTEDRYEVPTWQRSVWGSRRLQEIEDIHLCIRNRIDDFIDDFLKANPQPVLHRFEN
jgi:hypothetical protein